VNLCIKYNLFLTCYMLESQIASKLNASTYSCSHFLYDVLVFDYEFILLLLSSMSCTDLPCMLIYVFWQQSVVTELSWMHVCTSDVNKIFFFHDQDLFSQDFSCSFKCFNVLMSLTD